MPRWVAVAREGDLPAEGGVVVAAGERTLAVFRHAGAIHALDDACPHQGASLGEGIVHQGRVICPWHSWIFDLASGACVGVEGVCVPTYRVRLSGDTIEVEIPE